MCLAVPARRSGAESMLYLARSTFNSLLPAPIPGQESGYFDEGTSSFNIPRI